MASVRRGRVVIALAAAYLGTMAAVPMIGRGPTSARLGIVLSLSTVAILMLVQLALALSVVSLGMRPRSSALVSLLSVVALAALIFLIPGNVSLPTLLMASLSGMRNLLLMLVAVSFGYTVSFIVREPSMLLPVAVFAGLVDFWNVMFGPLGRLVEQSPEVVAAFAVQVPIPVVGVPATMVGMGDFVFFALYLGVLHRFSLNVKGAFWLAYALMTLSVLVVMKWSLALPALVPLGIGVLVPNVRDMRLSRQELFATLYVGLIVTLLLTAATVFVFRG